MKPISVVLMGLDGCGKTTQANLIRQWLHESGKRAEVIWLRGESYLTLPILKVAKPLLSAPQQKKREEPTGDSEAYEKYVSKKTGLFRNPLMRFIWRTLSIIDAYITLRRARSKVGSEIEFLIFDRYVYDTVIDIDSAFGAMGKEVEGFFRSSLARFFPQPDVTVLLDISPEEVLRRKTDIPSRSYLDRRRHLYSRVARACNAIVIDASQSIEVVSSQLIGCLKERLLA